MDSFNLSFNKNITNTSVRDINDTRNDKSLKYILWFKDYASKYETDERFQIILKLSLS